MSFKNTPNHLTIREAVTYSKLSRTTLWRLVRSGALPCIQVHRRRFIRICDLDALLTPIAEEGRH